MSGTCKRGSKCVCWRGTRTGSRPLPFSATATQSCQASIPCSIPIPRSLSSTSHSTAGPPRHRPVPCPRASASAPFQPWGTPLPAPAELHPFRSRSVGVRRVRLPSPLHVHQSPRATAKRPAGWPQRPQLQDSQTCTDHGPRNSFFFTHSPSSQAGGTRWGCTVVNPGAAFFCFCATFSQFGPLPPCGAPFWPT